MPYTAASLRSLSFVGLLSGLAIVLGLLFPGGAPSHADFPGTNGKIAFATNRDGNWEIYVMDADGTNQVNRTNNPAANIEPAWSPNGSEIAFAMNRDGNWEIYVMDADGTNQVNRTNNPAADTHPSWSSDGAQIVFESERDGNLEVYKMNANGSGQTNVTNNTAADDNPAWSPDGTTIAFDTDRDGNPEVYKMNSDGLGPTNLTNNAAADGASSWSPDGSQIAFQSLRDGNFEVYVMIANGTGQTNLTNNGAPDIDPAWSPDGTKIVFASQRDGNQEIYTMNAADGSGQTNLTNLGPIQDERYPDWGFFCPLQPNVGDVDCDRVGDIDEPPCESDPLNGAIRPERIDGLFAGVSDDGDASIDEALPAGAANFDCDGDGYKGVAESGTRLCGNGVNDDGVVFGGSDDGVVDDGCPGGPGQVGAYSEAQFNIGLTDQDPCGTNGWPSDFVSGGIPDSTNRLNILDVVSFIAPDRRLDTSPGHSNFNSRWDLQPGRGVFNNWINVTDLTSLIAGSSGNPPMLGGVRAFNGPSCPWAP